MITILLQVPHHHIHGHLHLLVILHMIPLCMVDPLFHPLVFYQSHRCPPFLLLMRILQVNMERGQALLQMSREHQQVLPGCHKLLLHHIHVSYFSIYIYTTLGIFMHKQFSYMLLSVCKVNFCSHRNKFTIMGHTLTLEDLNSSYLCFLSTISAHEG